MNGKFQPRDLVYNRNTTEDGAIRKVYETHGATMYEVAVPMHGDAWASGFCISDWAEDALQLSDNVRLKSATLAVLVSNLGSEQEFVETRILGCFLKNDEFGLGDCHALGLEQQVAEILVAAAPSK
jgi:hypothetical protein